MIKTVLVLYYYFKTKYFTRFKSREDLIKYRDKKVKNFLKKILKKSKYYAKKYENIDINDFKNLPTIDKNEMTENFDELNTRGLTLKESFELAYKSEQTRNFKPEINNITIGLSSGTSGNRGIFIVSRFERYRWTGTILAKVLPESIFKKCKIAFFLRADSNLYENVNGGNIKLKYFDMIKPVEENLSDLNEYKPDIIAAPPSMLKIIAENILKLDINPVKIISVAEVLEDIDKNYIENAFKQKVHQIYQATEGFLAATCKYGTLHLNEDIVCFEKEYISENKFVPIITDFTRTSQPYIRYRLNDILTESKIKCPCGSHYLAIEKIEGRCDDIFYLKSVNDNSKIPVFPDFISRAVIFASDKILDYKVIQKSENEIAVYSDCPEEFEKIKDSLFSLFKRFNCEIPNICRLDNIEKDKTRKFKRIENATNK